MARTGSAITVCSEISHSSRSPGTPWRSSSAADRVRQRDVDDVGGREVDGDRKVDARRRARRGCWASARSTHPAGEVARPRRARGERDELVGRRAGRASGAASARAPRRRSARRVVERDLRLVVQDQLVALDRAAQLGQQAEPVGRVGVALGACRSPRRGGRAWRRTSRRRRAGAACRPSCRGRGRAPTPMLASSSTATPRSANGRRSASCRRVGELGDGAAVQAARRAARRTRRRRAARACRRAAATPRRRSATSTSSASPWSCPSVSLTSLKRSRSISSIAAGSSPRSARSARRCSSERFGRPVSASCSAWWRSAAGGAPRRSGTARAKRITRPPPSSSDEHEHVVADLLRDRRRRTCRPRARRRARRQAPSRSGT